MIRHWRERFTRASPHPPPPTHQSPAVLVDLRNVIKNYPIATGVFPALKSVNMRVMRGEFVAVLGKSGSGKTTLMNMLTGIDRPTSGEVLVGGTAVHTLSEEQKTIWRGQTIGVVFQSFHLLPTLTVIENVMIPMDMCNTYPPNEFRKRAMTLLAQVEMTEHADKLPSATSGGQQQRIAIARALANDPLLIVADEPTGNLDSQTANVVFRLFENMARDGTTILMVTHDEELARRADRTIFLVDGEIIDEADHPRQPAVAPLNEPERSSEEPHHA